MRLYNNGVYKQESGSCSVISDCVWPHGLQPARLLCPWNSPGKNTGVGSRALLQEIFPTQGLNLGLLNCSQILDHLGYPSHLIYQFSGSVVSNSLWPYGLQHARLPCPAPAPGACSNSSPSSQWCHPSHPLSFPSLPVFNLSQHWGLFLRSQFFTSGGQSITVSASVLPVNIQDWFPLEFNGLILQSKGLSSLLQYPSSKASVLQHSAFFIVQLQYPCLENPINRGTWWATIHGVTKSWTRLID